MNQVISEAPWSCCRETLNYGAEGREFDLGKHQIATGKISVSARQRMGTVKVLSIGTDRAKQTVQNQIRLLLMEQSDQGLHCLPFHPRLFGCFLAL